MVAHRRYVQAYEQLNTVADARRLAEDGVIGLSYDTLQCILAQKLLARSKSGMRQHRDADRAKHNVSKTPPTPQARRAGPIPAPLSPKDAPRFSCTDAWSDDDTVPSAATVPIPLLLSVCLRTHWADLWSDHEDSAPTQTNSSWSASSRSQSPRRTVQKTDHEKSEEESSGKCSDPSHITQHVIRDSNDAEPVGHRLLAAGPQQHARVKA